MFWVFVRFFLLSTEISVLVFGLFFGHLDSRTSIRRVLMVTSFLALTYSICQGTLEIIAPDEKYYVKESKIELFSHGGTIFWLVELIFFWHHNIQLIFLFLAGLWHVQYSQWFTLQFPAYRGLRCAGECHCLVRFLAKRLPILTKPLLPAKKSFYAYTISLGILNFTQAIGSLSFYNNFVGGLCVIGLLSTNYIIIMLLTFGLSLFRRYHLLLFHSFYAFRLLGFPFKLLLAPGLHYQLLI